MGRPKPSFSNGLLAAVLAIALLGGAVWDVRAEDAPRFLDAIEDLPLMPGLAEDPESAVVFDSPSGRIVEVFATGNVDERKVLDFYADTLPQLGWRSEGRASFSREHEVLKVEFPGRPGNGTPLTVRFHLTPAAK